MGPPEQQAIQVVVDGGGHAVELWVAALGALAAVAGTVGAWIKHRRNR